MARLDRLLPLKAVLALLPAVFLLHDAEEILTVPAFAAVRLSGVRLPFNLQPTITRTEFAAAVGLIFAALVLITLPAARDPRSGPKMSAFLLGLATFAANTLSHPLQALALRSYTPGVISALLLALPYCAYALRRIVRAGLLPREKLIPFLLAGMVLQIPVVVLALLFGKWAA